MTPLIALAALAMAGVRPPAHRYPAIARPTQGAPAAQHTWTQAELERIALEIQADIEELRKVKFAKPVTVKLAKRADLRSYVEERLAKTETPEKLAADEAIAKLLGVVPPELDVMAETLRLLDSQVVGFYDPDSDAFSLMDTCPLGLARMTMAHELGHALDDQLWGIDERLATLPKDTDAQLAFWCVVEGSATVVGNRWQVAHAAELDAATMAAGTEMMRGVFDESPQWLWKPLIASYLVGSGFLQRKEDWLSAQLGNASAADLERAFRSPPASTEMALHPAKYWASEPDLPQRLQLASATLPAGWSVLREDTLGELACAIVAAPPAKRGGVDLSNPRALMGLKFTSEAAQGWDGDRVALAGKEAARVLRWRTVWDTPEDAQQFRAAIEPQVLALAGGASRLAGAGELASGAQLTPELPADQVELTVYSGVAPLELAALLSALRLQLAK